MLYGTVTVVVLPFQFDLLLFIFCLITLARLSSTMLNKSDESENPCFFPGLRGKAFSFSPLSMLAVGLSDMDFIMLRYHK